MRIQILSQYYAPEIGAPQVRMTALTRELVRRGHDVDVVTAMPNYPVGRIFDTYRGRWMMREELDGASVRRVWVHAATGSGFGRLLNYLSFALLAPLCMVRTKRPAIVIVESPPLFAVIPALFDRLVRRRRYALLVSDLWPDAAVGLGLLSNGFVARVMYWLEKQAYRSATIVLAVTDTMVEKLRNEKRLGADKIHLIYNGVDVDLFTDEAATPTTQALVAPSGERVIIFAGTMGYAQDLDVILDAAPKVRAAHPDVRFLFVGSGSERDRIANRIHGEHIDGVSILPPRPLEEVIEMYKVACAGITTLKDSPVLAGARPSKIYPMMASRLPVIFAGKGEAARLIAGAGAGVCVPPSDPDALASAIIGLLDDPNAMAQMGRKGRRLVEERYSWRTIVGSLLEDLERRLE